MTYPFWGCEDCWWFGRKEPSGWSRWNRRLNPSDGLPSPLLGYISFGQTKFSPIFWQLFWKCTKVDRWYALQSSWYKPSPLQGYISFRQTMFFLRYWKLFKSIWLCNVMIYTACLLVPSPLPGYISFGKTSFFPISWQKRKKFLALLATTHLWLTSSQWLPL